MLAVLHLVVEILSSILGKAIFLFWNLCLFWLKGLYWSYPGHVFWWSEQPVESDWCGFAPFWRPEKQVWHSGRSGCAESLFSERDPAGLELGSPCQGTPGQSSRFCGYQVAPVAAAYLAWYPRLQLWWWNWSKGWGKNMWCGCFLRKWNGDLYWKAHMVCLLTWFLLDLEYSISSDDVGLGHKRDWEGNKND